MSESSIYFMYGACVMFYFMMSWFFLRKNGGLLTRLASILMVVIGVQCLKDLFFISPQFEHVTNDWLIMTATDMVVVPLYAFILIELCRPRTLTWRKMALHLVSFVIPTVLFLATHRIIFYYTLVAWVLIYGTGYAIWTHITITKYHAWLKQRFSYDENINLNWLRMILVSFLIILSLWVVDCLIVDFIIDIMYMVGSLLTWMLICWFMYKHESVLDEFSENTCRDDELTSETDMSEIGKRITNLFNNDKIWLIPNLKLSDIAKAIGTNRTYVSSFFNKEADCTFYDFVNKYRIEYACLRLTSTCDSLKLIAEQSGFNSQQSFIRVFKKVMDMTPSQYRKKASGGG